MTISVTHATVATGTNSGTGEIHKAEWNAGHTVTGAADLAAANTFTAVPQIISNPLGALPFNATGGFQLSSNAASLASNAVHASAISVVGRDAGITGYYADVFGSGSTIRAIFVGRHASGTGAAPTATLSGHEIMRVQARGYGTTEYNAAGSFISFFAAEDQTDSVAGSYITFVTTNIGAIPAGSFGTPAEMVRIQPSGGVSVGDVTFNATDPGNGVLAVKSGVSLGGSSSGSTVVKAAAAAGSTTLTLPAGTTDFSATGGVGHVVKQNSAGGAFTVGAPQVAAPLYSNTQTSHTGDTNLTTLKTITIPAGAMGSNGSVRLSITYGFTGTAGAKTVAATFGGTTIFSGSTASNILSVNCILRIANRNATNSQVVSGTGSATGIAASATAIIDPAVDTTAAVTVLIQGAVANSADTVSVESYLVEIINPA